MHEERRTLVLRVARLFGAVCLCATPVVAVIVALTTDVSVLSLMGFVVAECLIFSGLRGLQRGEGV